MKFDVVVTRIFINMEVMQNYMELCGVLSLVRHTCQAPISTVLTLHSIRVEFSYPFRRTLIFSQVSQSFGIQKLKSWYEL